MNVISLELTNCYGISRLQHTLTFEDGNQAVAIYASNGTMKTSLARTLMDISSGSESRDLVFEERRTSRSVIKNGTTALSPDDLVVFLSYDETLGPTSDTSTLLVSSELRDRYQLLMSGIQEKLETLLRGLVATTEVRRGLAESMHSCLGSLYPQEDLTSVLAGVKQQVPESELSPYYSIPYSVVFVDRVRTLLSDPSVIQLIEAYVDRLNTLLETSTYLNKDSFNLYNAQQVNKGLIDNGFFRSKHSVVLRDSRTGQTRFFMDDEYEQFLLDEKTRLANDQNLASKFNALETKLNRSAETRAFMSWISANRELIPELLDLSGLEMKYWLAHLKQNEHLFDEFVTVFQNAQSELVKIEQRAQTEKSQWEEVIRIFNSRFDVPFELFAKNRERMVLGQDSLLELGFRYFDGRETRELEKERLLEVLSNGERKALYILNILFEFEVRRNRSETTLFVLDDIAESFDYKNKYAIIHYLLEMSRVDSFRLLILTHNFDFFRTIAGRRVVHRRNCLSATKDENGVRLFEMEGLQNLFTKILKGGMFDDAMKRCASIPYTRNLIEYMRPKGDPDFMTLTSLMHWKKDTPQILQGELDQIFNRTFGSSGAWFDPDRPVVDLLFEQAHNCVIGQGLLDLQSKITVSLAIRLKADKFMISEIQDENFMQSLSSNQTGRLFDRFSQDFPKRVGALEVLNKVMISTPEVLHVNSFMYEPIVDMSDSHLRRLYLQVTDLLDIHVEKM